MCAFVKTELEVLTSTQYRMAEIHRIEHTPEMMEYAVFPQVCAWKCSHLLVQNSQNSPNRTQPGTSQWINCYVWPWPACCRCDLHVAGLA